MYLINLALVAEVINVNLPPHGPKSAWAAYGLFWFVTIVFSTLLYKFLRKANNGFKR